jgi:hypothetical protein
VAPDPAFPVNPDPDSIWIQGLDDQKLKEKYRRTIFLIKNCNLLLYVQATGKSFSPQQGTPSTSKNEIYQPFPMFVGHFCSPRSGYGSRDPIESGYGSGSTALIYAGVVDSAFYWGLTLAFC